MTKTALRAGACIALAAAAALSHAATVNYSDWAYGNSWGHTVNVSSPNDIGPAGGFKGSVTFNGNENGFSGTIGNFISYCVELTEYFYLPSGNMAGYSVASGGAYSEWDNANGSGNSAAQTSARLGQLLSYADTHHLIQNADDSTSLQLAIWNVIYDTDNTLAGGRFKEQSGARYDAFADQLLVASVAWNQAYDVFVLTKGGSQDFVLTRATPQLTTPDGTPLPEPASLALAVLALGAAAAASRRRARGSATGAQARWVRAQTDPAARPTNRVRL